jgi:cyanophycin synthetase
VILDYAHNGAGLEALGEMIASVRHRYKRTICSVSIPGDRRDEDIIEMGRLSAGIFDILFFREDPAARGRPRGQIMDLLRRGALEAGAPDCTITLIAGEEEATLAALESAGPGDLVVITPTMVAAAWKLITDFEAKPNAPALQTVPRHLLAAE